MNISFIVRKKAELEAAGVEILQFAVSLEKIGEILSGACQRKRLFDPVTTLLIFLGQVLSADHSCRSAVANARAAGLLPRSASVHTGAYCQARDRLDEKALRSIATEIGRNLMEKESLEKRWNGRRVVVPDGSSVSLPDTPENHAMYPQPSTQADGCGFPIIYLCTLMSLCSGALLDFEIGSGNGNELSLWRKLWHLLAPGDVVLGDGKYSSYADIALLREQGIDVVARPGKRKVDFRRGKIIGVRDHIVEWRRPKKPPQWLGEKVLPEKMLMRELLFQVDVPGFRPEAITLATTLLDSEKYPKEDIAELFFCRWQVELRLRDIKTALGMDILRTKTPERARKELWMFLAIYNILRVLMYEASEEAGENLARISFQGTRQRLVAAAARTCSASRFKRAWRNLISDIGSDLNPDRPFRVEPRAIKRRKKQYDFLNQPRAILKQKLLRVS
jgi:hypothetical protein